MAFRTWQHCWKDFRKTFSAVTNALECIYKVNR
jgi:hypothetical protein